MTTYQLKRFQKKGISFTCRLDIWRTGCVLRLRASGQLLNASALSCFLMYNIERRFNCEPFLSRPSSEAVVSRTVDLRNLRSWTMMCATRAVLLVLSLIVYVQAAEFKFKEELQAIAEQVAILKSLHVTEMSQMRSELEDVK